MANSRMYPFFADEYEMGFRDYRLLLGEINMLEHMLAVGNAPGGGIRSHMYAVFPHVGRGGDGGLSIWKVHVRAMYNAIFLLFVVSVVIPRIVNSALYIGEDSWSSMRSSAEPR